MTENLLLKSMWLLRLLLGVKEGEEVQGRVA